MTNIYFLPTPATHGHIASRLEKLNLFSREKLYIHGQQEILSLSSFEIGIKKFSKIDILKPWIISSSKLSDNLLNELPTPFSLQNISAIHSLITDLRDQCDVAIIPWGDYLSLPGLMTIVSGNLIDELSGVQTFRYSCKNGFDFSRLIVHDCQPRFIAETWKIIDNSGSGSLLTINENDFSEYFPYAKKPRFLEYAKNTNFKTKFGDNSISLAAVNLPTIDSYAESVKEALERHFPYLLMSNKLSLDILKAKNSESWSEIISSCILSPSNPTVYIDEWHDESRIVGFSSANPEHLQSIISVNDRSNEPFIICGF